MLHAHGYMAARLRDLLEFSGGMAWLWEIRQRVGIFYLGGVFMR